MNQTEEKIDQMIVLLSQLIEKTQETNRLLKDGIKTRWGHDMPLLDMDPDRFKKNEGKEKHF